jgi:thymidylate kinase
MSLIVIEGPDGAGKTTLIEALRGNSTKYFAILRASGYPQTAEGRPTHGTEFMNAARIFADAMGPIHVVCDRFHAISENVYGPVLRKRTPELVSSIVQRLLGVDFLIYCRPPMDRIWANLKKNEQMEGVNEKTDLIVQAYDELMDKLAARRGLIRYDYTVDSIDKLRNLIVQTG